MRFPLIVKPNAEGSSKGIGSTSVVDTEEELRAAVKTCVERYRQPALVEEYIKGREFTVGLLGDKRPRVLPPMEIRFKKDTDRPVYDYGVKQEWEEHVYYECPARLSEAEQKAIEKIARATFWALDCRDVARVDMRMDADGRIYVLEVNPLPGLTPGYSDLVLIAQAIGMTYDQLIAEIMTGGLRRMRDKRREERDAVKSGELAAKLEKDKAASGEKPDKSDKDKAEKPVKRRPAEAMRPGTAPTPTPTNGNGNGANGNGANGNGANGNGANGNGANGNGEVRAAVRRERSEPTAAPATAAVTPPAAAADVPTTLGVPDPTTTN
jgi:D-alanine-D-alanine ligase